MIDVGFGPSPAVGQTQRNAETWKQEEKDNCQYVEFWNKNKKITQPSSGMGKQVIKLCMKMMEHNNWCSDAT